MQKSKRLRLTNYIGDVSTNLKDDEDRLVLVDFDYTLFSSNSTECFLKLSKPDFFVAVLLALRKLIPWKWSSKTSGARLRDYMTVFLIAWLTPWNLARWRRQAKSLFAQHTNHQLAELLKSIPSSRIIIVSFGFDLLIEPLLKGSAWEECRLISMSTTVGKPTRLLRGKLPLLRTTVPPDKLKSAIFITDSEEDEDVLNAVKLPYLIEPTGPTVTAEEKLYLPLRYLFTAKFSLAYAMDQVVFVDLPIALLAASAGKEASPHVLCGITALFLSLTCIYEIGYFENDTVAARNESKPVLSNKVEGYRQHPIELPAWIWGTSLALIGATFLNLQGPLSGHWENLTRIIISWAALSLTIRATFYAYNRRSEKERIPLYLILQTLKSVGIIALVKAAPIAIALPLSQAVVMTIKYAVYRLGGDPGELPRETVRAVAFAAVLSAMLLTDPGLAENHVESLTLMSAWCLWRAIGGMPKRAAKQLFRRAIRFASGHKSVTDPKQEGKRPEAGTFDAENIVSWRRE